MSTIDSLSNAKFIVELESEFNKLNQIEPVSKFSFYQFMEGRFYYSATFKNDTDSYTMKLVFSFSSELMKPNSLGLRSRLLSEISIKSILNRLCDGDSAIDGLELHCYDNRPEDTDNDNEPYNYKSISTVFEVQEGTAV